MGLIASTVPTGLWREEHQCPGYDCEGDLTKNSNMPCAWGMEGGSAGSRAGTMMECESGKRLGGLRRGLHGIGRDSVKGENKGDEEEKVFPSE